MTELGSDIKHYSPLNFLRSELNQPLLCSGYLSPMALEEMMNQWENFNLTNEEESTAVEVDQQAALVTTSSMGASLIGKLLAPRIISGEVMRKTFKSAWSIPKVWSSKK